MDLDEADPPRVQLVGQVGQRLIGVVLPVYTWSQWAVGSLEVMAYQSPIRVPSKQHSCSAPRSGYREIQYRALWLL